MFNGLKFRYIIIDRMSGLLVQQEVPNANDVNEQRSNVTGSLKFKGEVWKELKILNFTQYHPPAFARPMLYKAFSSYIYRHGQISLAIELASLAIN